MEARARQLISTDEPFSWATAVASQLADPTSWATFFNPLYDAPPQLIGIFLAIGGNLIISFSLALTKYAHNLNQLRKEPLPYTRLPLWWCGLAATVVGEAGNFAAYGFAGASLIAPLGAVSVLANAFIAALLLGEGLRCRDITGCLLCIAGGSIVVLATPSDERPLDPRSFIRALQATPFVVYIIILIASVLIMLALQDTYGHKHVAYFVLLCSLLGSVTVMSCKGVATFLNLWLCCGAEAPFGEPVLYLLLLVLASTAILQIRYLNQAMEKFGNTETVKRMHAHKHVAPRTHNLHASQLSHHIPSHSLSTGPRLLRPIHALDHRRLEHIIPRL